MSTQRATGIESTGPTDVAQLMNDVDDDNLLKPVVSALLDRVDELEGAVEALSTGNEHAHERADELDDRADRAENGLDYAHSRIDELEAGSGDANPTPETGKTGSSKMDNGKSPLEQLTNLPEHVADEQLSENQQRARFVAKDVLDYADSTPKGLVIDSREVSRVLQASEGESPHSQTVTRVMDFLDAFGKDDVETRIHKGRRIAVFDETAAKRFGSGPEPAAHCDVIRARASG